MPFLPLQIDINKRNLDEIEHIPPHVTSEVHFYNCPHNDITNEIVQKIRAKPFTDDLDKFFKFQNLDIPGSSSAFDKKLPKFDKNSPKFEFSSGFFTSFDQEFSTNQNQNQIDQQSSSDKNWEDDSYNYNCSPLTIDQFLPTVEDIENEFFLNS